MEVKRVQKKLRLSPYDCVRYQIITELIFLKKENIIPFDIEILTLLALWGPIDLSSFCNNVTKKLYKNIEPEDFAMKSQNVRNRISKLQKRNFVIKKEKQIYISPKIEIYKKGNILLDYNFLSIDTVKT